TTATVRPTTTTTLAGCGGTPGAPTFVSIDCQLDALIARLAAEPLGALAPKLMHSLETAKTKKVDAEGLCRESNLKKTKKRLQQVARALGQFLHRLSALAARKKLDPTLRGSLLDDGRPIQTNVKSLRDGVSCPGDAPPQ